MRTSRHLGLPFVLVLTLLAGLLWLSTPQPSYAANWCQDNGCNNSCDRCRYDSGSGHWVCCLGCKCLEQGDSLQGRIFSSAPFLQELPVDCPAAAEGGETLETSPAVDSAVAPMKEQPAGKSLAGGVEGTSAD